MPMNSEAKSYGFKGRQPIGRSIVEGRGNSYKLTVWAQDLKAETFYKVFLLFADKKGYAGIEMGNLLVDEKGKGETRRDFDGVALGEFALADIVGVAVVVRDAQDVVSPLCGYRDQPVLWRHGFYEYTGPVVVDTLVEVPEEIKAVEELPEVAAVSEEACPEEAVAVDTFVAQPPLIEEHAESPVAMVDEDFIPPDNPATQPEPMLQDEPAMENLAHEPDKVEDKVIPLDGAIDLIPLSTIAEPELTSETPPHNEASEEIPMVKNETAEELPPADTEPFKIVPPHKTPNQGGMAKALREALDKLHEDNLHQNAESMPNSHFLSIFESKEAVTPFQRQARNTKWVRFNLSDPVPPPINNPHLFDDPFILAALEAHEHLILGKTIDQGPCRYIIGVPGVYDQASRLKAKRLGFVQFKCSRDAHPTWGDAGYWLMFISVC